MVLVVDSSLWFTCLGQRWFIYALECFCVVFACDVSLRFRCLCLYCSFCVCLWFRYLTVHCLAMFVYFIFVVCVV